jgi:hypothetical protein
MTTFQKAAIITVLALAVGLGIFKAKQAADTRVELERLEHQQVAVAGELQQLQQERDDATNRLAALNGEMSKQRLELLSLRGRVTQLAREARGAATAQTAKGNANRDSTNADSILFSASLTNRVASGQTLAIGGWPQDGRRSYLLITVATHQSAGGEQVSMQSQMVSAPEAFWNEIGWGAAKSELHRSRLASVMTSEQLEILLQALKATQGAEVSTSSPATGKSGAKMGFGFSISDDYQSGAVMGIDVYPYIVEGGFVNLEIRPTSLSPKDPIHPRMQAGR